MQELKFSAINLAIRSLSSLMILVGISSWQDFLMLRLLIIFSTSLQQVFLKWKVESNPLALILTILGCLSKDLITHIIRSRLSLAVGEDLGFGMFIVGTTLKKSWSNVSQSSSSIDTILLLSRRLIFSPFDELSVNNGWAVLQKLLLAVFFSVKIFKVRFLSVFQESSTEISLGVVVFFVSIGSMFQEFIS